MLLLRIIAANAATSSYKLRYPHEYMQLACIAILAILPSYSYTRAVSKIKTLACLCIDSKNRQVFKI